MRTLVRSLLLYCAVVLPLAAALAPVLHAQQDDGAPNVLVIHREYLKPGKGGMLHQRSESAFVKAFADAKSPYHYFALDSLSGPARSLFMFSYNSFAEWEKEVGDIRGNPELAAKVDQASLNDGDLLSSYDAAAMALRPDLSLKRTSLDGQRYFDITAFVVKPGHVHEFEELAKMYKETFSKIDPDARWDVFEVVYGNPVPTAQGGDVFLVFTLMKSLADVDKSMKNSDKMAQELGAAGMQKLSDLSAASIASSSTNLFSINPRISNPAPEWVKKEPAFWKVP